MWAISFDSHTTTFFLIIISILLRCSHILFDDRKCNINLNWNKGKGQCESKNLIKIGVCKKDYWNPSTCAFENDECLRSIISDLVVTCDEIAELLKNTTMNFSDKKATYKIGSLYILFASLLITILLFIIINMYFYYYHVTYL